METSDGGNKHGNYWEQRFHHRYHHKHSRLGQILGGMVILATGVVLLTDQFTPFLPHWAYTWKMFLIVLGIFIGARHRFAGFGWFIPILIGGLFLVDEIYPEQSIRPYIIPALVILAGLVFIFRPRRSSKYWKEKCMEEKTLEEDMIESTAVFGGVKKNIITKNFKGGEITCVFGGAEINFSQADIQGKVVLEVNQVFGGTKLIIPPHWKIQTETVAILGSVEDKRPLQGDAVDNDKLLVIRGSTVFGGIDITSY